MRHCSQRQLSTWERLRSCGPICFRPRLGGATGQKAAFLLADTLQILTYIPIFASLLLTLRSRSLNERNQHVRAERRISLCLVLFVILNVAFVWVAIATAPSDNILRLIQIGD